MAEVTPPRTPGSGKSPASGSKVTPPKEAGKKSSKAKQLAKEWEQEILQEEDGNAKKGQSKKGKKAAQEDEEEEQPKKKGKKVEEPDKPKKTKKTEAEQPKQSKKGKKAAEEANEEEEEEQPKKKGKKVKPAQEGEDEVPKEKGKKVKAEEEAEEQQAKVPKRLRRMEPDTPEEAPTAEHEAKQAKAEAPATPTPGSATSAALPSAPPLSSATSAPVMVQPVPATPTSPSGTSSEVASLLTFLQGKNQMMEQIAETVRQQCESQSQTESQLLAGLGPSASQVGTAEITNIMMKALTTALQGMSLGEPGPQPDQPPAPKAPVPEQLAAEPTPPVKPPAEPAVESPVEAPIKPQEPTEAEPVGEGGQVEETRMESTVENGQAQPAPASPATTMPGSPPKDPHEDKNKSNAEQLALGQSAALDNHDKKEKHDEGSGLMLTQEEVNELTESNLAPHQFSPLPNTFVNLIFVRVCFLFSADVCEVKSLKLSKLGTSIRR